MSDGGWRIESRQKGVAVFGGHNYLALVRPDGTIERELHGGPRHDGIIGRVGPLNKAWLNPEIEGAQRVVTSGAEPEIRELWDRLEQTADNIRHLQRQYYFSFTNSNSFWHTLLKVHGYDPAKYAPNSPQVTPGWDIDLRDPPPFPSNTSDHHERDQDRAWFAEQDRQRRDRRTAPVPDGRSRPIPLVPPDHPKPGASSPLSFRQQPSPPLAPRPSPPVASGWPYFDFTRAEQPTAPVHPFAIGGLGPSVPWGVPPDSQRLLREPFPASPSSAPRLTPPMPSSDLAALLRPWQPPPRPRLPGLFELMLDPDFEP